jgi:hypothetical protein
MQAKTFCRRCQADSLTGGFWTAVQTPGAPLLRVMGKGPDGVLICWPAPSAGWVLQETTVLASNPQLTKWADVTAPPVVVRGEQNTITRFQAAPGSAISGCAIRRRGCSQHFRLSGYVSAGVYNNHAVGILVHMRAKSSEDWKSGFRSATSMPTLTMS